MPLVADQVNDPELLIHLVEFAKKLDGFSKSWKIVAQKAIIGKVMDNKTRASAFFLADRR